MRGSATYRFCGIRRAGIGLALIGVAIGAGAVAASAEQYRIGGPLAGVELPLLEGDHGEPPGHPGCVPASATPDGKHFSPQGQGPQWELYPGSVELWRSYMHKYMPIRSFFDRQSQRKRWTAPDLPGADAGHVESYAAPLYWVGRHHYGTSGDFTGLRWDPVEVVRTGVNDPVFPLDFGTLPAGLYCIRVVAAVETGQLRPFRKSAVMALKVNDGRAGEWSEYRVRIGYVDEFYSVAEIYFHAPVERAYSAELRLSDGSEVDLLVRDILLDDALAGCDRRPIKTRTVLSSPPENRGVPALTGDTRLARDRAIWRSFPPINAQGSGSHDRNPANPHIAFTSENVQFGVDGADPKAVAEKWGAWQAVHVRRRNGFAATPDLGRVFMVNQKLGLEYTVEDVRAGRPLPDPYPHKDTGLGVLTPVPDSGGKRGQVLCPVADAVDRVRMDYWHAIRGATKRWEEKGDPDAAHDAAVGLIRFAYQFPAIDTANMLPAILSVPGLRKMDSRCRKRATAAFWLPHYGNYHQIPDVYDGLFSYIRDNEDLAKSVGRFVPWVETSADVIELLDVYLIQTSAKRQMRYHYHTGPYGVLRCAAVLGEKKAARPLFDWVFSSAWKYPLEPAGMQNVMITAADRTGRSYVGSWYYATPAWQTVEELAPFKEMGLLPAKYDVGDSSLYPKPIASLYWALDSVVAGRDFPRIADVCGPDKAPWAHVLPKLKHAAPHGWRATGDPAFARAVVELELRNGFDEKEWAEILAAAAALPRAPWLDNRSRQIYNWIGVLETGHESDDYRDRRAAYLRVGAGYGHHHNDTLDLQISAFGLPMTIDGGQRPNYATPADRSSRVHNVVGADDWPGRVQSWVRHIADARGARYLSADAAPAGAVTRYRRGIALVDVDTAPFPSSYVVDFFRVDGGANPTYRFHGALSDEVTATMDFAPVTEAGEDDMEMLGPFKATQESWLAGDAPETLRATWRYAGAVDGPGRGEKEMLGKDYGADEPRKYTRLHLLGVEGARACRADAFCKRWKYSYNQLMVRPRQAAKQTAFAAVVEPYAGTPFIEKAARIPVDGDADRSDAAAVEVLTRTGRRDITCYADDFTTSHAAGGVTATGEFAFLSTDGEGFRQAVLARGTVLQTADVTVRVARPEYRLRITDVDYRRRTVTLEAPLPDTLDDTVAEIVCGDRTTSATIASVEGTTATMKLGACYFRSLITGIEESTGEVVCKLSPVLGTLPGLVHDFTASDDDRRRFWRADFIGNGTWRLTGAAVNPDAFGADGALRVWEYGQGDILRISTWAAVRRIEGGWEISANEDCEVTLPDGTTHTVSAARLAKNGGRVVVRR